VAEDRELTASTLRNLIHDNHGREFWATLGRLLLDYEARREQLRIEGPRFVW